MRASTTKPDARPIRGGRMGRWIPLLLVGGSLSLGSLPSYSAALDAALSGAYLIYAAAVTWLLFLPWLSARLN